MDKKAFKKKLYNQLVRYLNEIHKKYQEAKLVPIKKKYTKRVFRGRGRIIASDCEDLFAKLLCRIFKSKKIIVFVDQPILLVDNKQTYYPDIIITKKLDSKTFVILFMIDLKMDIGWHRNSALQHPQKLKSMCKEMKACNKLKADAIEFSISKDASYDMVVISSRNSGKNEQKLIRLSKNNKKTYGCYHLENIRIMLERVMKLSQRMMIG